MKNNTSKERSKKKKNTVSTNQGWKNKKAQPEKTQ